MNYLPELNPQHFHRLLHSTIRLNETIEEKDRSSAVMLWVGENILPLNRVCTEVEQRLLNVIWRHYQQHKHAISRTILDQQARAAMKPESLLNLLEEYDRFTPELKAAYALDMPALLEARTEDWTRVQVSEMLARALTITNGSLQADKRGEPLAGARDAINYVFQQMQTMRGGARRSSPQGEWTAHAGDVFDNLMEKANPHRRTRLLTGLKPIDDTTAIGPGTNCKFIGIVGGSNHGKSALLLPLVYQMAMAGHSVCLAVREATVADTWERLAWIHAGYLRQRAEYGELPEGYPASFELPSLSDWTLHPERVTEVHKERVSFLTHDIKHAIPGKIDVIMPSTWEDIKNHMECNDSEFHYGALVVDYIAHLDVPDGTRDRMEFTKQTFRNAQMLSVDWRDGDGLLVMTPMQANKTGVKEAGALSGVEFGTFGDNYGAVDYYTSAAMDADALWSVFQGENFKKRGIVKVGCIKSRGGPRFEPFCIQLDPNSRDAEVVATTPEEVVMIMCEDAPSPEKRGAASSFDYSEQDPAFVERSF